MKETDTRHIKYIVVGKLGSAYGVQGWIKLHTYTEPPANILNYSAWYIEEANQWSLIERTESREQHKRIIVKFSGIHNPEQARLLTGKKIAVLNTELPPLKQGEYYWSDLEGLTVINHEGAILGKVIYLLETGSNDVLVIKNDSNSKEHAIPYLSNIVKNIDLDRQIINVHWELI
ncbi:MAG: rimM [Gammaproteobacteria bacterium]|jgi:16S rRNA processing protein RimM|nr:rimM [Gammaproteobacteria bacterium]MCE3237573.1 rimM [Gammaproteobacteria bacterium]